MEEQQGRLIVAEVRVYHRAPDKPKDPFEQNPFWNWSEGGESVPGPGVPATVVPGAGLTTTMLRQVKLGTMRELGQEQALRDEAWVIEQLELEPLAAKPDRPGRKGYPPEQDIVIAATYVRECDERGEKGAIPRTADRLSKEGKVFTADWIRKRVARARERGLLSPTRQGKGGGELTAEATALMREARTGQEAARK